MGCEVYANGDEIACKAGDGKVIAAFPDVCLSPPSSPAGPIPVPYPDTSFSKDMQNGSKAVMIKGKEVMLKDLSYYKTSPLGDEAATKTLGQGVITHVITGKTYFVAWSMDVKFEGENVDRHIDLTTSNHASPMANESVTLPNASSSTMGQQLSLLCECCNQHPPHSAAQARGESLTEDEWHSPSETGPRRSTGPGGAEVLKPRPLTPNEKKLCERAKNDIKGLRELCPGSAPNDPAQGPCDKYYRIDQKEKDAADSLFEELNRSDNPLRPAEWSAKGVKMIAHRVPRSAGGCPVGSKNTHAVTSQECKDLDNIVGSSQNEVLKITR